MVRCCCSHFKDEEAESPGGRSVAQSHTVLEPGSQRGRGKSLPSLPGRPSLIGCLVFMGGLGWGGKRGQSSDGKCSGGRGQGSAGLRAGEREVDRVRLLLNVLSPEERHTVSAHTPLATLDDKGGGNVGQLGAQEKEEMSLVTSYPGLLQEVRAKLGQRAGAPRLCWSSPYPRTGEGRPQG